MAAVAEALARSPRRVVFAQWQGKAYVVKRIAAKTKRKGRMKLDFLMALARWLFPGDVAPGRLLAGDGLWEVARNQALARAGERVPRIVLYLPEAVVYEHCGQALHLYLKSLPRARQQALMRQALADLARFHRAGHWHGAAQFRNMIVVGEDAQAQPRFCRIDFEEDLAERFSLPLLQLYDLGLLLTDALEAAGDGEDGLAWGQTLLADYRAGYWHPDYARLLPRLDLLARPIRLLAPVIRRWGNWESRRVLALAQLLGAAARQGAPS
jgi:tRNA A-37 threonylcarbamoyl transferase component Bud32